MIFIFPKKIFQIAHFGSNGHKIPPNGNRRLLGQRPGPAEQGKRFLCSDVFCNFDKTSNQQ
jgi:hypothetical protein